MSDYRPTLEEKIDDLCADVRDLESERDRLTAEREEWAIEARAQKAIVRGICRVVGMPESERTWEAVPAVRERWMAKCAEVERLRAENETWEEKARAWMASPEAAARLAGYRELGERAATAGAEVERLREALHEIADLAGWHCDLNADPEDTSPEDMAAHINGLIVQKAHAACEEGGSDADNG